VTRAAPSFAGVLAYMAFPKDPWRKIHTAAWAAIDTGNPRHARRLGSAARPAPHVMGDLFPTKASIQKIDLEGVHFPDATFDRVIAHHVLEHVGNVETALAEAPRVLKSRRAFRAPDASAAAANLCRAGRTERGGPTAFFTVRTTLSASLAAT
jgi:SAM-dependent methyltransferase